VRLTLLTREGREIKYAPKNGGFEEWKAIPCLRCGVCCTRWQPQIDGEEAGIIAQGLEVSLEEFYQYYVEENPLRLGLCLLRRDEKGCIFLQYEGEQASCIIHPFRPTACRQWMPSLSRPECREGLKRCESGDHLLLPSEIYGSEEELSALCHSLENLDKIKETENNE
jgi:Fe-S-cluster containining protein